MNYKSNFADVAQNSEWARALNATKTDIVFISSDIDWAPEYAIELMLEEIKKRNLKISLFATHNSPVLKQRHDFVEMGLHPDYGRANIRGGLEYQIKSLMDMYPDAVGTRSHQNFFGQNTCNIAHSLGLKYEASNIQWRVPFQMPHRDYNGMVRIPYYWEDGIHADMGLPWNLDELQLDCAGLKVINFHPVFLFLNAPDDDFRRKVTANYTDLASVPFADMNGQRHDGEGAFTYFQKVLDHLVSLDVKFGFLSDLT